VAEEDARDPGADGDPLEDAEEPHVRPGLRHAVVVEDADDVEEDGADEDAAVGGHEALLPEDAREREDDGHAREEHEEREDQVEEGEALPGHVIELCVHPGSGGSLVELARGLEEHARPDDPEHVEAAQGIDGDEAVGGRTVLGWRPRTGVVFAHGVSRVRE
jgi:hypothetical protein